MDNINPKIVSKIDEISDYGYASKFQFEGGELVLRVEEEDYKIEKRYVAEQVSIEAEYLYEDEGLAILIFMTHDGELGHVIDEMNENGKFPLIDHFDELED